MMRRSATALPDLARCVPPQRDGRSEESLADQQVVERHAAPQRVSEAERTRLRALVEHRLDGGGLSDFLHHMDRIESELVATYGQDWH